MRTYCGGEVEEVLAHEVSDFFPVDLDFAVVDGEGLEEGSSPVVDVFVGHDQFQGVKLCL